MLGFIIRNTSLYLSLCVYVYIYGLLPFSGTELLKPLESPKWWVIEVSFVNKPLSTTWVYVNKVTFGKPLSLGLVARETNLVIRGLVVSPCPPLGKVQGRDVVLTTKGQWFNQPCLCNETSIKIQKDQTQRASQLINMRRYWESGMSKELPSPFPPHLALCISSVWLYLNYILLQ